VLVSEEQTFTATFDIPNEGHPTQMARKKDGEHANPEHIRADVDCRAARPKFDNGAWSATKISDGTSGGLYLLITPDPGRPGKAAKKLWQMAYRFHGRQKTYSIGPYGNGNDGTVSLATARQKRDAAKALLAQDPPVDPSIEKQVQRHRRAAERPLACGSINGLRRKRPRKSSAAGPQQRFGWMQRMGGQTLV
jgi:Arm DNA-binding domain